MSDYTPGPWSVKFRNDHSAYISLGDSRVGPHKQFDIEFDDRYPSDVADARLIAAAPELLEALQQAFDEAIFPSKQISNVYERARQAIAKATGEQQ